MPYTDPLQVAWFAGLFEGEGSVGAYFNHTSSKPKLRAELNSSDRDVLEKIIEYFGEGRVYGPYPDKRKTTYKPLSKWYVYGLPKVEELFEAIGPWLGERRREQFITAIECWEY